MKNIPNAITVLRILLAAILCITSPLSYPFFMLYTLAGLSDMADGFLGRKLNIQSSFGAKLDSIADGLFFFVCVIKLWHFLHFSLFIWIAIFLILSLRIASLLICHTKFHTYALLHTYLNKIAGLVLFLIPFFLKSFMGFLSIIVGIVFLSALEETMLMLQMQELDRDIKGFFLL